MNIKALASGSKGNCYHISDGKNGLLIEAGISIKEIKKGLNFKLHEVDGCLISHEHSDHSKAIEDVLRAGINCYMSYGTQDALGLEHHNIIDVNSRPVNLNDDIVIKAFKINHDAADPRGFFVWSRFSNEKLVYITDSYYSKFTFQNVTHWMIECNYSEDIIQKNVKSGVILKAHKNRVIKSHFGLENVKKFFRANDLSKTKEIWLLHLSDQNSDEKRFKEEIQALTGVPTYVA